jgi:hypothetical protein
MDAKRKSTKENLNKLRVVEQKVKSDGGKLGDVTVATQPEDIITMYAGKMALMLMEDGVRASNIMEAYKKSYNGVMTKEIEDTLKKQIKEFRDDFKSFKEKVMKRSADHPLSQKVGFIKGITPYRIAILIALIKDINKFDSPSKLMVYAGLASINGMAVCKRNIHKIKDYYAMHGKEFNGFNTRLSGQMYTIGEQFLKARGFFYNYYQQIKDRLITRAMTNNETEKREGDGALIMKGKKNQPLKAWAHANAQRRMMRTFLHIFWTEWRTLKDLPLRNPYAVDYLGHKSYITLADVEKAGG